MGVCTTPEGLPTLPLGRAIGETLGETSGNNLNFLVNLHIGGGGASKFQILAYHRKCVFFFKKKLKRGLTGNVAYALGMKAILRGLFAYWRDLFWPQRPL